MVVRFAAAVVILLGCGGTYAEATVDLDALSRIATGGAKTPTEKVRAAIDWTHQNMSWTATDYKRRTVEQIIERKGGNCFDQTLVVSDLLTRVGVKTRHIREINIQPRSEGRRASAADRVAKDGFSASVFGYQHNDHVWIEYWDSVRGEWQPADPTTNVVGIKEWEQGRVSFAPRGKADVVALQDMIVPIGVLAEIEGQKNVFENRSEHYLIDGFGNYVSGAKDTREWHTWVQSIRAEQRHIEGAFAGTYNLEQDDEGAIEALRRTYDSMKAQSARR